MCTYYYIYKSPTPVFHLLLHRPSEWMGGILHRPSGTVLYVAEEIERWEEPLDRRWGRHADIEFAVSMVSPERGPAFGKWLQTLRLREDARKRTTFDAASEAAGVPPGELLETIMADEKLTDLFRMAVELASRTGDERKLQALGRALASGALANDDAEYDEAPLLMRTISQLESADVRALLDAPKGSFVRMSGLRGSGSEAVWVHLERLGLVEKVPGNFPYNGPNEETVDSYRVSTYGKRILSALLASADKQSSENDDNL